jgi:peptidoglycan/LPS O-acetylase OafA/YrhL
LAAGSLLAIVLRTAITRVQVRNLSGLLIVSSLFLALAGEPFGIIDRTRLLGAAFQWTLLNLLFAGVVLLVLLVGSSEKKRYVNIAMLRFVGYISYGLYLNHLLAFRMYDRIGRHYLPQLIPTSGHFELVLLRFAVAGGAAVFVAYLSRRFFEERFLRLKDTVVPRITGVGGDPMLPAVSVSDTRVA